MGFKMRYSRGHVEWTAQRYFIGPKAETQSRLLVTRIKRMADEDRKGASKQHLAAGASAHAFFDAPPAGTGHTAAFSRFDAFMFCVALTLLDAGLRQSDVVHLLRFIRNDLRRQFKHILTRTRPDRAPRRPKDAPELPTRDYRGATRADPGVYMLIRRFELKELVQLRTGKKPMDGPKFLRPRFFNGVDALADALFTYNLGFRAGLVLEIAHPAHSVVNLLERAPDIRRGPRSR